MDMTGEYRISAPRQRVWEALNDPEVLKAAIPGCEELTKLSDHEMEAKVRAKVGPVSATFTGRVTLGDLNPPISYKISGEGKGGAAGYAKGGADVSLAEDGAGTVLSYNAKADVGGKLAQIGSRLIQGTARKMADDFFGKFSALVAERYAAEAPAASPPVPPTPPSAEAAAAAAGMSAAATGTTPPLPAEPAPQPAPARQVAFQPERPPQVTTPKVPAPTAKAGQPWYVWLIGAVILVIVLFWLFG
ncbi:MAG: carbon monoxide dehydrogenase subunit G [Geminicoccaceae bacterium]